MRSSISYMLVASVMVMVTAGLPAVEAASSPQREPIFSGGQVHADAVGVWRNADYGWILQVEYLPADGHTLFDRLAALPPDCGA